MSHTPTSRRPKRWAMALAAVIAALLVTGSSCNSDLDASHAVQQDVMERAIDAVPPYQPTEFPAREAINWYLQETEAASEWYVYALNEEGTPVFYVVSSIKPLNICVSISSPDRKTPAGVISAPALDGVYYGGAGCDAYYMQDVTTGNFIEIAGRTFTIISSKVPLGLETDAIRLSG